MPAPAAVLTLALPVLVLVAAFDHGAVSISAQARINAVLALLAAGAASAWLWSGSLRIGARRLAAAGAALLALFTLWCGLSLIWSVDPGGTWNQFNRTCGYVLMLVLGLACGASATGTLRRLVVALELVCAAVTTYALTQKVLPGLHGGVALQGQGQRLQLPLDYWNALAMFLVLGVPGALLLILERRISPRFRLLALSLLTLELVAVTMTLSRGGLLALGVALVLTVALSRSWLRALMWLGVALCGALPGTAFGLASASLTEAGVSLARRQGAGLVLLVLLVLALGLVWLAGRRLQLLEASARVGADGERAIRRWLAGTAAVVAVVGLGVVAVSHGGIGGTASDVWHSFTGDHASASVSDPHRLFSADSEHRWAWWKEAVGAFSDRPLVGWGAGSFPQVHLLYRRDALSVRQPHNVPLQWLAETGLTGALLAAAGCALLLAAGFRGLSRIREGWERSAGVALLTGVVAYCVHCLFDWDWDIPALTLPVMLGLGAVCGTAARARQGATAARTAWRPPAIPLPPRRWSRMVALVVVALMLCAYAASALLPSLAATQASKALTLASSGGRTDLQAAVRSARLAAAYDPLSDAGLMVQAQVALQQGRSAQAQALLLHAIRRQPSDAQAWDELASSEVFGGNLTDAMRAAERALSLDPRGGTTQALADLVGSGIAARSTPPQASATAVPLPGSGG